MIQKNIRPQKNKRKKIKIGRYVLLFIVVLFVWKVFGNTYTINQQIIIQKGDTFQNFIEDFSTLKKLSLKIYLYTHKDQFDLSKIQEGTYTFDGKYSKSEFLTIVKDGPKQNFNKYTILEGWSIYDIDLSLSDKGLIEVGDYISFVNNADIIGKYQDRYDFLKDIDLDSLEGFLYPDTYHIDIGVNVVDQLVYLQLENFNTKVWDNYESQIESFDKLSRYDILVLASVVEKEERNIKNKPTVAGVFFNRIDNNMRLDADITLCYGLHEPYETCTPSIISKKIYDKNNIFNTRQVAGIPPQPISNPSEMTIGAVLNFKKTNYFYYLHDSSGVIHYGATVAEHNENKRNYLN